MKITNKTVDLASLVPGETFKFPILSNALFMFCTHESDDDTYAYAVNLATGRLEEVSRLEQVIPVNAEVIIV